MKPHICFIAGTKGGIGKSFAACQMAAAAEELGLTYAAFDSDTENSTLKKLLKDKAEFLDDAKEDYPLDKIVTAAFAEHPRDLILVDMKAGTSRTTMEWFESVPWEELASVAEICIVGAVTVDPESVQTLMPWILYFQAVGIPVQYLIVKNEKDGKNFIAYEELLGDSWKEMKNCSCAEVTFPAMDKNYIAILNNAKVSLKTAISSARKVAPLNTIMAQSRLRNYYCRFVDPLIQVMAEWIPEKERSEDQTERIQEAVIRLRLQQSMPGR